MKNCEWFPRISGKGVFCLLVSFFFLQLINFQISIEPRTELRYQISKLSKESTASCSSKVHSWCIYIFYSRIFPYITRFLNSRDNQAWEGFALKCRRFFFFFYFVYSWFQQIGLNHQVLVCVNHNCWGSGTKKFK